MSNSINDLKGTYFRVLDKGYVGLVDWMGDDTDIEAAARTSYGKGTRKVSETRHLLRYLMRHRHSTPFEMCELKIHIKMPMDHWRQMIRHRTASVNEYSTRYSEAIDDKQETTVWRPQSKTNKQGSDEGDIHWGDGERYTIGLPDNKPGTYLSWREEKLHEMAEEVYKERLSFGVAREQARKDLPLSTYTVAYWKIDLKNLLHFMSLRCDSHAQLEIREYANVIAGMVKEIWPLTFEAWYDYHFMSVSFSRSDRWLLHEYIKEFTNSQMNQLHPSEHVEWNKSREKLKEHINNHGQGLGLGKREIEEFWSKLNFPNERDFSLDMSKVIDMEQENG